MGHFLLAKLRGEVPLSRQAKNKTLGHQSTDLGRTVGESRLGVYYFAPTESCHGLLGHGDTSAHSRLKQYAPPKIPGQESNTQSPNAQPRGLPATHLSQIVQDHISGSPHATTVHPLYFLLHGQYVCAEPCTPPSCPYYFCTSHIWRFCTLGFYCIFPGSPPPFRGQRSDGVHSGRRQNK